MKEADRKLLLYLKRRAAADKDQIAKLRKKIEGLEKVQEHHKSEMRRLRNIFLSENRSDSGQD